MHLPHEAMLLRVFLGEQRPNVGPPLPPHSNHRDVHLFARRNELCSSEHVTRQNSKGGHGRGGAAQKLTATDFGPARVSFHRDQGIIGQKRYPIDDSLPSENRTAVH